MVWFLISEKWSYIIFNTLLSFSVWPYTSYTDFIFCLKEQFIYDLPTRLGKCIKSEAYADAVRFYTGAMPIFEVTVLLPVPSVAE